MPAPELAQIEEIAGRQRSLALRARGRPPKKMKFGQDADDLLFNLRLMGCTVAQICAVFDVDSATIYRWLAVSPQLREAWARGGTIADARVTRSLYELATGYSHPAVQIFKPAGEPPLLVDYTKHYPPDERAIGRWLNNRQPETWREKIEVQHSGTVQLAALISLSLEDKPAPGDGAKPTQGEVIDQLPQRR